MNHYAVLGLSSHASATEIKTAYRKHASTTHPDRPGGNAEKFRAVQTAYEILSDPEKKQTYDQEILNSFVENPVILATQIWERFINQTMSASC
jgi:curved DNA-binding protein CbpA